MHSVFAEWTEHQHDIQNLAIHTTFYAKQQHQIHLDQLLHCCARPVATRPLGAKTHNLANKFIRCMHPIHFSLPILRKRVHSYASVRARLPKPGIKPSWPHQHRILRADCTTQRDTPTTVLSMPFFSEVREKDRHPAPEITTISALQK